MKRIMAGLFLFLGLALNSYSLTFEDYWSQVQQHNPHLNQAKTLWQADEEKAHYLGLWPNPMIKASILNLPINELNFDRTPMSGKQLMLTQDIPWWQAPLQGEIARAQVNVAQANYEKTLWELRKQSLHAYYALWYDREEERILNHELLLYQKMASIARAKYERGNGLEQDVLRAQLEEQLLQHRLLMNASRQVADQQMFIALLGDGENPLKYEEKLNAPQVTHLMLSQVVATGLRQNPELDQLRSIVKLKEKEATRAATTWIPTLEISGYYTWRENVTGDPVKGEDFVGAAVGLKLPLLFPLRETAQAQAGRLALQAAQKGLADATNNITAQLQAIVAKLEQLEASYQLYQHEIIPQVQATVTSSLSAYQTGKSDFLTVVNNESLLIQQELDGRAVALDYMQAVGSLEALVKESLLYQETKAHE